MKDYEQQAEDFLRATGTRISIRYLYTGGYFSDDEAPRDVYEFTLTNTRGSYTGTFGDSIQNSRRTVKRCPSPYDILSTLVKDDSEDFESWCDNYGYADEPLREYARILRIYQACVDQYRGLARLFSAEQMDQLRKIS